MTSRQCPVCYAVVDASSYRSHRLRHVRETRERPGGSRRWRRRRQQVLERDGWACVICQATTELEVHHVDGDWRNDALDNLETRCFTHNPRGGVGSLH
jgi:hypothetical protein